jgi:hypothetical protein
MSEPEDLKKWMSEFKNELDDSSSELIFERLTANHFKTRTQIKLLSAKELDIMFNKTELPLGAKALLIYQLEKLRNESPLPIQRKRTRPNVTDGAAEDLKHIYERHEEAAPAARKVS